jgi:hypothetical protein
VYDPKSWAEEDEEEEDITAALARTHPEAARLYAAGAIDANVVAGLLGVDADAEKRRARRGLGRGLEARALLSALKLEPPGLSVAPGKTPNAKTPSAKTPGAGKTPGRPASTPSAVLMSPEEVIAAAFAEAAEKREAAEAAVAAIGDPKKVAMVRDDALKAKPTTTAGRLIKAANNADQRAEKIQAGGGGDGRALRVQGVRKSEKSFGAKTPGKPGRPAGSGARAGADAGLKPSEAPLMERAGAGAEAFEFRPPLAKTPQAAAAAAYAAVAEEAKREEDEPEDAVDVIDPPGDAEATMEGDALKKKETRTSRDANPGADGDAETATKKRRRVSTEKTPSVSSKALPAQGAPVSDEGAEPGQEANAKDEQAAPKSAKKKKDDAGNKKKTGKKPAVGAAGWGDGDRELAGDKRVTKWLEFRGFGEYAAAFAARGITLDKLKALTMSDLEDVNVEGAAMREKIFAAAAEFAKEAAERAAKRAEKNKTAPSEPPKKKTKTAPPAAE